MNTTTKIAHDHALRGLLMLANEVEHTLLLLRAGEIDGDAFVDKIAALIETPQHLELVMLARAALETPAPTNRKTFYGIVSEQDLPKGHSEEATARGPILMETYLNAESADRAQVESIGGRFAKYGWVRIAEVHVDFPETPAAIPAASALTHD